VGSCGTPSMALISATVRPFSGGNGAGLGASACALTWVGFVDAGGLPGTCRSSPALGDPDVPGDVPDAVEPAVTVVAAVPAAAPEATCGAEPSADAGIGSDAGTPSPLMFMALPIPSPKAVGAVGHLDRRNAVSTFRPDPMSTRASEIRSRVGQMSGYFVSAPPGVSPDDTPVGVPLPSGPSRRRPPRGPPPIRAALRRQAVTAGDTATGSTSRR
jgi:hypothetical protein